MTDNAARSAHEAAASMTPPQPASSAYILDNALEQARERLSAGAEWLDPWTIGQLEAIGVGQGWACLEAGAGGGSITKWLCKRVGEQGRVLATDIDPRFLGVLSYLNLEVQRHDITTDALPENQFDLAHARLLLCHLPSRDLALSRMIAALKPGGWLVVEDFDHITCGVVDPSEDPERASVYQAMWAADIKYMDAHGVSLDLGRRLYQMCRDQGLVHVEAEGHVLMSAGGSAFG
ncbi:MAG TPA: methyltransferase domain-containing protein, partial [Chloroflexota bacterium]|nr:methyltransferase domain-containing protein [Chloroflexota bacterium]